MLQLIHKNSKCLFRKIEYDDKQLLSIKRIDDSEEIAPPPYLIMYIELLNGDATKEQINFNIKFDGQPAGYCYNTHSERPIRSKFHFIYFRK